MAANLKKTYFKGFKEIALDYESKENKHLITQENSANNGTTNISKSEDRSIINKAFVSLETNKKNNSSANLLGVNCKFIMNKFKTTKESTQSNLSIIAAAVQIIESPVDGASSQMIFSNSISVLPVDLEAVFVAEQREHSDNNAVAESSLDATGHFVSSLVSEKLLEKRIQIDNSSNQTNNSIKRKSDEIRFLIFLNRFYKITFYLSF